MNQRDTILSIIEAIPEEALPDMLEYLLRHHGQQLGKAAKDLMKARKDLTRSREQLKASNVMIKQLRADIKQLEDKLLSGEQEWGPDDETTPGRPEALS